MPFRVFHNHRFPALKLLSHGHFRVTGDPSDSGISAEYYAPSSGFFGIKAYGREDRCLEQHALSIVAAKGS